MQALHKMRLLTFHSTYVQSNDVVAGLADLFSKFDAQERLSEEQQESAQRQIVAPTKLRDALHALDPHRFSTGMPCLLHHAPALLCSNNGILL